MKNVLRWISLLPGCFAAMILVNFINAMTFGFVLPDFVDQCLKSWFGSIGFVLAAYYIAPNGKFLTTIVVASAYCAIGTFAVTIALQSGVAHHPAWLEITTTVISIVASVLACIMCHSFESEKKSESLKEAQGN